MPKYLTARRVMELSSSEAAPNNVKAYKIDVSDIGSFTLPADKPEGQIEMIAEVLFPTHFEPPHAGGNNQLGPITPSTPTDFGKIKAGWTVHLSAKPYGKVVELSGTANFVKVKLLPAGYGALAGPIYADRGDTILTTNKIEQPLEQTTTTHFNLFALSGETYEVTLYRDTKAEKHAITVTVE